ncbi:hypothetical protein AAHC03_020638 [Spirometra sp. Aus1]
MSSLHLLPGGEFRSWSTQETENGRINSLTEPMAMDVETLENQTNRNLQSAGEPAQFCTDSYLLTQICFTVNLIFLLVHVGTISCVRKAREIHGWQYLLAQSFLVIAATLTLSCCAIGPHQPGFRAVALTANFAYLTSLALQTLSVTTFGLRVRHETVVGSTRVGMVCCREGDHWWANPFKLVGGLLFILGLPLSMTLQQAFEVLKPTLTAKQALLANYSCNFYPDSSTLYFLITPALVLLALQMIAIGFTFQTIRAGSAGTIQGFECAQTGRQYQRLATALKLSASQALIWLFAFGAVFSGSAAVWHIFTLSACLQASFVAVSCILSRAVLGSLASRGWEKPRRRHNPLPASI